MKYILLSLFLILFVFSLNATGLTSWISLGTSNTSLSNKNEILNENSQLGLKVNNFTGFQIGLNLNRLWDNRLFVGTTFTLVERGWIIESDEFIHGVKNTYIDGYSKFGYALPEIFAMQWKPYVGLGASQAINSNSYSLDDLKTDFIIVFGVDLNLAANWVLSTNYSIGTQSVVKDRDVKYRNIGTTMGLRF